MTKDYYSTKEVAEKLSLNKQTILSLINTGKLKAANVAVGKRAIYRITQEELNKFINK
jgi:excisionase family DNA binding protein